MIKYCCVTKASRFFPFHWVPVKYKSIKHIVEVLIVLWLLYNLCHVVIEGLHIRSSAWHLIFNIPIAYKILKKSSNLEETWNPKEQFPTIH